MNRIEEGREECVQELRRAMGTLPSEAPRKQTAEYSLDKALLVEVVSGPDNPYRAIFESATATWGDDQYQPKWDRVSPEGRFKVCLAALTGNTLPQALEVVSFLFRVRGTPRWLFEEHAREINQFITFLSVGCRDNNKLDASMIRTGPSNEGLSEYMRLAKDNYQHIIESGQESWQSARALLPMSYHHPYLFYTSYLGLASSYRKYRKREGFKELTLLLEHCGRAIGQRYPLLNRCISGGEVSEDYIAETNEQDKGLFEGDYHG